MNSSSNLLVPEFPQMTVLNLVFGGTIFTEGGPVNNVLGGQYSLHNAWGDIIHQWNNVRGDNILGDTVHYDGEYAHLY